MRLEPHFSGLTQPTDLRFLADGRALGAEQRGKVVLLGQGTPETILDLQARVGCCGERGLLSLAPHPDFSGNGLLFLYATAKNGDTTVSRVTLDPQTLRADPDTYRTLLTIAQPGPTHNGGQLQFGPDRHLYLSTGDGEYRPSWLGALLLAQETTTLLGKLLRFKVDAAGDLAIPEDNPFNNQADAKAVWALGLRNPWRFSFDVQTDELFVADVGETAFEEVNVRAFAASRGANYGWPRAEGTACRQAEGCAAFVAPAVVYTHDEGCSVTGGYVYRGANVLELTGRYLYGDFCNGVVWVARRSGGGWTSRPLLDTPLVISGFAQDDAGEVYLLDYAAGTVYRFVAAE